MRRNVDMLAQHPAGFAFGQVGHDPGPGSTGRGALAGIRWPLHDGENRRLQGPWLAFASAPQVRAVGVPAWAAADIELVHLDRAVERILARYQQPESVAHAPGRRLADADRLG